MTIESVPSQQDYTNRYTFNWRRHSEAVAKPAFGIFCYTLVGTSIFLGSVARLLLRSRMITGDVAVDWYLFAVGCSFGVAAFSGVGSFFVFRREYIELGQTSHEQTRTEYKTVKQPQPQTGTRDYSKNDGSLKVGKYRFTHRQRRQLARVLAVGDNLSHERLKQVGLLSGDIKSHDNRNLANDIQNELIRLGYAEPNGRNTQLTVKGYREWLDHPQGD